MPNRRKILNSFQATPAQTSIQPLHLDGVQGAAEQRSKPYMKYGARAAQSATPQSAKSTGGVPSFAGQQASAAQGLEKGMTSIVVVFVLVTLLTLIGIGFTKVMNRSLQSSAASQQASAANYAAQSGVNDVLSYLKTNPATAATKCDDLIKTGGPLASAAKISSDGNTAYTCVLVDPNPTSLFYQGLAPYKSQIVKITTPAQLSSLLFSWQSPNRQHNQFVPVASGQTFYDEKTWSDRNYAPPLRLTLYPIPASGDLSNVQADSKTFFLYPQTGGSNTLAYSAPDGIAQVNCGSKNLGGFSGSADYDCNLVIDNLPSAAYFYARFAPYYDQAVVKIKGNDGSAQAVQFKNVQSVVDVTAKSGGATKRLQARVDTSSAGGAVDFNISSGSDIAPEFALGSASTICKRLVVPPSVGNPVTTDPASAANCPFNLYNAPTVSIIASPPTIASGGSSTLTWTTTNADKCTASGDWRGSQSPNNTSPGVSTGPLSGPKTYTYTLTCTGPGGSGNGGAIVTVNAPPSPPTINKWIWNNNDSFTYNVSNSSTCTVYPDDGGTLTIAPVLNQDTQTNDGHPNAGATLKCWNQGVGPATAYAAVAVTVHAGLALGNKADLGSNYCNDPAGSGHYWVACVIWFRSTGAQICTAAWEAKGNYSNSGPRVILQPSGGPLTNSDTAVPFGFANEGTPIGTLSVTCFNGSNPRGQGSCPFSFDGNWKYEYRPAPPMAEDPLSCGPWGKAVRINSGGGGGGGSPTPSVRLTADPNPTVKGGSTNLRWSTANVTACTGYGGDFGGQRAPDGGTQRVTVNSTTNFSISCRNNAGTTAFDAVTVTATQPGGCGFNRTRLFYPNFGLMWRFGIIQC